MNITKKNDELVLRIPLKQKDYDAIGEYIGDVPNLIGIVAGNEYSISHLIALGYKDDIQEGSSIIMFESKEELEKICKELDIDIWIHPVCSVCKEAIRGVHTWGDKGAECLEHEKH